MVRPASGEDASTGGGGAGVGSCGGAGAGGGGGKHQIPDPRETHFTTHLHHTSLRGFTMKLYN